MSLNIKNERTHRMAREPARATGKSMSVAVSEAIRERLERILANSKQDMVERILKTEKRVRCSPQGALQIDRPWRPALRRKGDAQVMLDSSAIIAVLRDGPEARAFTIAILAAANRRVSAVNYVEAAVVASRRFDDFFRLSRMIVETVTSQQAQIARQAYRDFGNGRHKAGLNFGDCFAYALAKDLDEPLLFKGTDFAHTDIEAADI